ncbi:MAG: NAD(P)-binding protein [Alphaproteobacteria bacterium]|nr:NAD(P)-binding protein [Alphaproteobacteria bacterium]
MANSAGNGAPSSTGKDPLLQPLQLKHLTLRNRIMSTSHACGLEDKDGYPADRYQSYHEEKAKGGIALTMFGGSSNIAPDSPSVFRQLYVGDDGVIPHLQRFSERIHAQGAALMIQITHLGRRGDPHVGNFLPTIAPSPIRETLHRSIPKEMDDDDIARVVTAFGEAARRCKEGGLDGLETLAGAHLIGQFLSPATNHRTDKYGGSIENRCRFGLMVYDEIRRVVGDDFIVGFRFVVDEAMSDGLSFEECVKIAGIFEKTGHLDYFNAVYGRMDTAYGLAVDNMPGMASPLAPWLHKAAAFKQEISLPVFHAARIADVATARHAIAEGLIDMAGMTRAHIADPHLVSKLAAGNEEQIRPCVGTTHCMSDARPSCIHNPSTGRERNLPHKIGPADTKKKVVVIGGGPAGLEAARVCATRGHQVKLFEAANALGGQVRLASTASWRGDVIGLADWRAAEIERLGVVVEMNKFAEPVDVLAEDPGIIIVATGGVPNLDWLPSGELCTSSWDALTEPLPDGGHTIVYDGTGRHAALTCAERLAMAGRNVELVTIDDAMALEMAYAEKVIWKRRAYELKLPRSFDERLIGVEREGNRLCAIFQNEVTNERSRKTADQIIVEYGTLPADNFTDELRGRSKNNGTTNIDALLSGAPQPNDAIEDAPFELHRIGDAVTSRDISSAILDAFRLCRTL